MERQKFEDSWKDAFKDAEVSPSDNLWTNIELDLERAEGKVMKKRVLFFKLLAAASVLFAMTFAGIGYYYINNNQSSSNLAATGDPVNGAEVKPGMADQPLVKTEKALTEIPSDNQAEGQANSSDPGAASAQDRTPAQMPGHHDNNGTPGLDRASENQLASGAQDGRSNTATTGAEEFSSTTDPNAPTDKKASAQPRATQFTATNKQATRSTSQSTLVAQAAKTSSVDNRAGENTANNQTSDQVKDQPDAQSQRTDLAFASETNSRNADGKSVAASAGVVSEKVLAQASRRLPVLANVTISKTVPSQSSQFSSEADPVKLMMERLKEDEARIAAANADKKGKNRRDESIWTSVGFSAGAFNTYTSGSPSASIAQEQTFTNSNTLLATADAPVSNAAQVVKNQTSASGNAYSIGLSVGGKISSRWVIQGGVNYLAQNSNYSSNAVVVSSAADFKAASLNEVDKVKSSGKSDTRLLNTANYNVNSSVVYMSVPLQAGYMVINRNFGLQFNAGVSTDLFVRNTLTPDQGTLEKTTQGNGEDSPYRPLNFSGLAGTELSYRFSRHYRIAINPGVRYPFSSIYKSDVAVDAMPLTFDVGMKFRYIFH